MSENYDMHLTHRFFVFLLSLIFNKNECVLQQNMFEFSGFLINAIERNGILKTTKTHLYICYGHGHTQRHQKPREVCSFIKF